MEVYIKCIFYEVIFYQIFSLLVTDLSWFHLNVLKRKIGLNHLLNFFLTRELG